MNNQNDKELFKLVSTYKPTGDQPEAIAKLVEGMPAELAGTVLQKASQQMFVRAGCAPV